MKTPNRVVRRDENTLMAVDRDGKEVAFARRQGPRTIWYVTLREYFSRTTISRPDTPHARISGKLPAEVQHRLVHAILEAA